ncbi:hypothetical protein PGTUg99_022673 [Puccinia graminis f. sp. tritici]|uniref:Uncharacterized protein n=1 Tax=Puccinia graminis f. sp. tritici TaxID=56615 RepID=A0A5B0RYD3_PUCGR|nr:hypothetical protein PGTUg99_022673 [Puccinia graminis f. sp. tritici]
MISLSTELKELGWIESDEPSKPYLNRSNTPAESSPPQQIIHSSPFSIRMITTKLNHVLMRSI